MVFPQLLLLSVVVVSMDALRIQGAAGTTWFEQPDEVCFKKGRGPKEDPSCVCWGRSINGHTYPGFMWCCYGTQPWGKILPDAKAKPKSAARRMSLFRYYKSTLAKMKSLFNFF